MIGQKAPAQFFVRYFPETCESTLELQLHPVNARRSGCDPSRGLNGSILYQCPPLIQYLSSIRTCAGVPRLSRRGISPITFGRRIIDSTLPRSGQLVYAIRAQHAKQPKGNDPSAPRPCLAATSRPGQCGLHSRSPRGFGDHFARTNRQIAIPEGFTKGSGALGLLAGKKMEFRNWNSSLSPRPQPPPPRYLPAHPRLLRTGSAPPWFQWLPVRCSSWCDAPD